MAWNAIRPLCLCVLARASGPCGRAEAPVASTTAMATVGPATDAWIMAIVPTTDLACAKAFYGDTLDLVDANAPTPSPQVIYRCGGGSLLEVYERSTAGRAPHTRVVGSKRMRAAVDQLRNRGVRLEEYNLPEVKTEDGISSTGDLREAWFRDPDGNILRIHSHVET